MITSRIEYNKIVHKIRNDFFDLADPIAGGNYGTTVIRHRDRSPIFAQVPDSSILSPRNTKVGGKKYTTIIVGGGHDSRAVVRDSDRFPRCGDSRLDPVTITPNKNELERSGRNDDRSVTR